MEKRFWHHLLSIFGHSSQRCVLVRKSTWKQRRERSLCPCGTFRFTPHQDYFRLCMQWTEARRFSCEWNIFCCFCAFAFLEFFGFIGVLGGVRRAVQVQFTEHACLAPACHPGCHCDRGKCNGNYNRAARGVPRAAPSSLTLSPCASPAPRSARRTR